MSPIDCIIYTKNRACQLDLLLRSVKDKLLNVGKIFILYNYSDTSFRDGYLRLELLVNYNSNISFIHEDNFKENLMWVLNQVESLYFLGLCDDDCFINEVDTSDITNKLYEPEVSSISIKGGLNIKYNYPNIKLEYPKFIEIEPYLKWEWRKCRPDIDWGYPTCINSYIYLVDYYKWLTKDLDFYHPPSLEAGLNTVRDKFKSCMVSFKNTRLLNIPVNRTQTISPNIFGEQFNYSVEELNNKFLEGYRISTKNIYGVSVNKANKEIEFK